MVGRAPAADLLAAGDRAGWGADAACCPEGVTFVPASLTRLAMATAGVMLAHLWAAKAVRNAVFLTAWDPTRLPAMVFVTAVAVVASVPIYARLLGRFGPDRVVPVGLLLSSAVHVLEWRLSPDAPWVAVLIYLHIAGAGALLLSGFWSLASELFDPQSARAGYGRIAAAGTAGGLLGGLAIERISAVRPDAALLLLAAFHATGAVGAYFVGRQAGDIPASRPEPLFAGRPFDLGVFRQAPHFRVIALLVALSTGSAFLIEYLFQAGAASAFPGRAELQQFLARFYLVAGVATSLVQMTAGRSVRHLGLGRTIASLPAGLGATAALTLVFQIFPMVALTRAVESMLRSSLFRSAYELLFVPMDPEEKRRIKTFLDVACDRAGEAAGAVVVQIVLLMAVPLALTPFLTPVLLALVILMAGAGLLIAGRLDRLYFTVVERRLTRQASDAPIVVPSEAGWTVIGLSTPGALGWQQPQPDRTMPSTAMADPTAKARPIAVAHAATTAMGGPAPQNDPRLAALVELRSGDRDRVKAALGRLHSPSRMQIAQVTGLLAWDDVAAEARVVLERHAAAHIGLLVDALVDASTDFAVRRRLPRVLGMVESPRAVEGLLWALDDERFEVRYQAARALDRMHHHANLPVDPATVMRAIDRELSIPVGVWQAQRLIDRGDDDESAPESGAERHLAHVFTLLSTILPRDAVQAARQGLRSADPRVRGVAVEYLDSVLPPAIRTKFWARTA
jgi:hypothetical protein